MFNQFKSIVHHFEKVPDTILEDVFNLATVHKYQRNTILLTNHQTCHYFYFILEGGGRTFYITKEGKEKTRLIAFEIKILTVLHSFVLQQPSNELIQLLEDSTLLALHHDTFFCLIDKYPEWDRFYRKVLERAFFFQNKKIENHVTLTAKERYELLCKEDPQFIQRVSNKILASYLDIREETLSRLKSKN